MRSFVLVLALLCLSFEWEGRLARLVRDLDADDPELRVEVVHRLATYPAETVRAPLLRALADRSASVRLEAADVCGRVGLREAAPVLLDWLDDPDDAQRAAAARALGGLAGSADDPAARGSLALQVGPGLVRALGDADAPVRRAAVRALGRLGGAEVVVPLLGRLDDEDAQVRADAAEVLGRLRDPRAIVPLVGRARDGAPEVRAAVAVAVGALADVRALPVLLQDLRDDSEEVRLAAIGALGRVRSDQAVPSLAEVVVRSDPRASRAALGALGAIGSEGALDALLGALSQAELRATAIDVLVARVAARATLPAARAQTVERLAAALDLPSEGPTAGALCDALVRVSRFTSIAAATPALLRAAAEGRGPQGPGLEALAATGDERALVVLLEAVRAEGVERRGVAFRALDVWFDVSGPDGRAADPLLEALGAVTSAERTAVVRLLGRTRAARALDALLPLLESDDEALRAQTIEAIGAIGDAAGARALMPLLRGHDARVRFLAAAQVGASADAEGLDALLTQLDGRGEGVVDRHALVLAIGRALRRNGGVASEPLRVRAAGVLTELARSTDDALAARALDALADAADARTEPTVLALLGESGRVRRRAAARALSAFDSDAARAALREGLGAPDSDFAAACAVSLGEIGGPSDARALLDALPSLRWPAVASAAFALARLARRDVLDASAAPALCTLTALRDPYVRANAAVALAAIGAPPCPGGASPLAWLGPLHAAPVRAAAARWASAALAEGHLAEATAQQALDRCAQSEAAPEVAEACRSVTLPPLDDVADLYAWDTSGTHLLARRLIALRLADGSVLVTHADANGHVALRHAPRGRLLLDDPRLSRLEPP